MILYPERKFLFANIMSGNPSKKIRLDFQNKTDGIAGKDDLWGQDDLTAEEFDMLEIQATQSCNQNVTCLNSTLHNNTSSAQSFVQVEEMKQLQYELEGRVKLLSHSLEKSTRELNEERLNREHILNEKMKEFYEREANLRKEVEKMQSILEFKEQEMKSTYSKLQVMKSHMQDKKGSSADMPVNMKFDDLKSLGCGLAKHSVRPDFPQKFNRKHKLLIDTPKGEIKSIEILSSILCTRLAIPSIENALNNTHSEELSRTFSFAPSSVVHLRNEQKSDELLEYCISFLQNHVNLLKTLTSKNNVVNSNKNSPISTKWKEAGYSQTVVSYLCDIAYMYSCPGTSTVLKKSPETPSENVHVQKTEEDVSSFGICTKEKAHMSPSILLPLLESLSALSNPGTYPIGYFKNEEIEFSLSALLSICLSCSEKFLDFIGELPVHSLLNPHQSVTGLCTTLKLITTLCSCESFTSYLVHRDSNCILCLTAAFLQDIVPHYPQKFSISVILVEDFFSSVFSIHNFLESHSEVCECFSGVIQGLIKSLWKYYQVRETLYLSTEIIRKGFLLLHFMSCCFPNFKERRSSVEDEYISLISGILTISKENSELREFYDLIHNLWDFQTDINEFDLDELSEETQTSTSESDIQ